MRGLVEVLATASAALRSGRSPAQAWWAAGVRAVDGVPVPEDLAACPDARPEHVAAVRAVCRLTGETGAPAAAVLDRMLAAVAADVAAARAREAALAGPRATARLLVWLPLVGALVGAALGADPVGAALDGGGGTAAVLTGCVLSVVGRRWTAALVRRAEAAGTDP